MSRIKCLAMSLGRSGTIGLAVRVSRYVLEYFELEGSDKSVVTGMVVCVEHRRTHLCTKLKITIPYDLGFRSRQTGKIESRQEHSFRDIVVGTRRRCITNMHNPSDPETDLS